MPKPVYFFILLFFASLNVHSQGENTKTHRAERAYEVFKETFNKELDGQEKNQEQPDTPSSYKSYTRAVNLPEWFFDFQDRYPDYRLGIGISDPGLDSSFASEQAYSRAMALLSLTYESDIKNISDNYYFDQAGKRTLGKFNSFTLITTDAKFPEELTRVLETFFTTNAEIITLVGIEESNSDLKPCHHVQINMEFFQSEGGGQDRKYLLSRLFFKMNEKRCNRQQIEATWLLDENKNGLDIQSKWNNEQVDIDIGKFRYVMPDHLQKDTAGNCRIYDVELKYGLWSGFINTLVLNLEDMEVFNSQIQSLDDKYELQYQDLTRVTFSQHITLNIREIEISENKIRVLLN